MRKTSSLTEMVGEEGGPRDFSLYMRAFICFFSQELRIVNRRA